MKPWYRHLWPWLLMSGPFAVLAAGGVTMWLAFSSADGLVADDYYKQGLAINRRLAREEEARRLGITAEATLLPDRIVVRLRGEAPPVLFVQLTHATRAGHDMRLRLSGMNGLYTAPIEGLPPGHWRVIIEDPRGAWRIAKEVS